MDLSGNLYERPVTVGAAAGRTFNGVNGDGALNVTGDANVTNWPDTSVSGFGFRGGVWSATSANSYVSDRSYAASPGSLRNHSYGGRAARTAP